jgi:hypothetical protein
LLAGAVSGLHGLPAAEVIRFGSVWRGNEDARAGRRTRSGAITGRPVGPGSL